MIYWRARLPEIFRGYLPDGRRPGPSPFPVESTDVQKGLRCYALEVLLRQISLEIWGTSESVNNSRLRRIEVTPRTVLFS